jgi:hypothetical protein
LSAITWENFDGRRISSLVPKKETKEKEQVGTGTKPY